MAYIQITEVKGHLVHFLFQKLNFDKTTVFCFVVFFSLLILYKAIKVVFRLCLRCLSVTNDAYLGLDIESKYQKYLDFTK